MQQNYKYLANKPTMRRAIMLFFCCLLLSASAMAQSGSHRITLHRSNISVIEALKEVEKQTHLSVGYNESRLKDTPAISVSLDKATLENSLAEILKNTGYTYQLEGKYIVIVPRPAKADTAAPAAKKQKISGLVLDENGDPVIGATVRVKGTGEMAVTDADGKYTLSTDRVNPVVTATYIGYKPIEVKPTGGVADLKMAPSSTDLGEVVVTALGIKREQKALSYNVQQIKSDDINTIKDANFVNSLNGKVAGVVINTSSSGVGGASRVVMRGTKSIEQSSNALYVIDGVPMYNFGGGGDTEFGSKGSSEAIADLNPEDIESISVLTGAAAAALYGSNAANGAV